MIFNTFSEETTPEEDLEDLEVDLLTPSERLDQLEDDMSQDDLFRSFFGGLDR